MSVFDVIITANSPGEVVGWVRPVVAEINRRAKRLAAAHGAEEVRVSVFLPPCVFASGAEKAYVQSCVPGVALTLAPREYLRYAVTRRFPGGFTPSPKGVVLFLGSDLMHAALLSRRLGYPALAYTQGVAAARGLFQRFLVPYESTRQRLIEKGVSPEKIRIIGNLMLDAVSPTLTREEVWRRWRLSETGRFDGQTGMVEGPVEVDRQADVGGPTDAGEPSDAELSDPLILLLPGSRPAEVRYLTGFFLEAAELLARDLPGARFAWSVSPFVSEEAMRGALSFRRRGWEWSGGELAAETDSAQQRFWTVRARGGLVVRAIRGHQNDLMAASDMALTVPGTNTAELAYLGVPMIVAVPLNFPEEIPLEGLAGLVGAIPGLGHLLKRNAIPRLLRRRPFTALPNLIAGEPVVPEVRGMLRPMDVTFAALELWRDPRRRGRISEKERQIMGEKGASARLVDEIEALAR